MNISGFTTDNTVSTGSVAQLDFNRSGKIGMTFHVHQRAGFIGLSIAGFCTSHKFYLKPTEVQKINNTIFYNRFIQKFSNKEELDAII